MNFVIIKNLTYLISGENFLTVRNIGPRLRIDPDCLVNISSEEILPGDLVQIESNKKIPCDLLILRGTCVVDEAILTGESVPMTKQPVVTNQKIKECNLAYAGTDCLLEREEQVLGMALRTGWSTTKGQIVASLVYNHSKPSLVIRQVFSIVKVLLIAAILMFFAMMLYDFYFERLFFIRVLKYLTDYLNKGLQPNSVFMVFISVFLISKRLKSDKVACLKTDSLYKAARVDTICFDKTGTLTENKIIPRGLVLRAPDNSLSSTFESLRDAAGETHFADAMTVTSCCHDLYIHEGELVGDPIDVELFKFSRSSMKVVRNDFKFFVDSKNNSIRDVVCVKPPKQFLRASKRGPDAGFAVMNVFPFSSESKTMGVVVKHMSDLGVLKTRGDTSYDANQAIMEEPGFESSRQTESLERSQEFSGWGSQVGEQGDNIAKSGGNVFDLRRSQAMRGNLFSFLCKGAPENVKRICRKETVPLNFDEKLDEFARQGLRVIAFANKSITRPDLIRSQAEADLNFLGFMVFENPLREGTQETVAELDANSISCKMITGDHVFAGVNIGYASGLIDMTESVWVARLETTPESSTKLTWQFFSFEELMRKGDFDDQLGEPFVVAKTRNQFSVRSSRRGTPSDRVLSMKTSVRKYKRKIENEKISNLKDIRKNYESCDTHFCLAIDGAVFEYLTRRPHRLEPQEIRFLMERTKIFGRSNPDQKQAIVRLIKKIRSKEARGVAFVGDGANDCKALNSASFGLSLGSSEASMASPFVSSGDDIGAVLAILRQGRFSLENYLNTFTFLLLTSLIDLLILFFLLFEGFYFPNWKYFLEFFYRLVVALLMTMTPAPKQLSRALPSGRLLSPCFKRQVIFSAVATLLTLLIIYYLLRNELIFKGTKSIFTSINVNIEKHFSLEVSLLIFLNFSIVLAVFFAVNRGRPFKMPLYYNWVLIAYIFVIVALLFLCVNPTMLFDYPPLTTFFLNYARTNDFQGTLFVRWLLFSLFVSLCFYFCLAAFSKLDFLGRMRRSHKKAKRKFAKRLPVNEDSLTGSEMKSSTPFINRGSQFTISISHSITYDDR